MLWLMEKSIFDQPVKNDLRTYDNIQKNVPGQGAYYTTGCLLDYAHLMVFRKQYSKLVLLAI